MTLNLLAIGTSNLHKHALKTVCLLKITVSMHVQTLRGPSTASHHCQNLFLATRVHVAAC